MKTVATKPEPVVRAAAMYLSLTRPQIKRTDGVIEVSQKLIAEHESALIVIIGRVIYSDKKSGENAVRLIFRAVPHEKFLQISEILEDCWKDFIEGVQIAPLLETAAGF